MKERKEGIQRNWIRRILLKITSSKFGARIASRVLPPIDRAIILSPNQFRVQPRNVRHGMSCCVRNRAYIQPPPA